MALRVPADTVGLNKLLWPQLFALCRSPFSGKGCLPAPPWMPVAGTPGGRWGAVGRWEWATGRSPATPRQASSFLSFNLW